jgi:hypothetical protein
LFLQIINAHLARPPIRVSYHLRSHYNSVVFPQHERQLLRTAPGEAEDASIRRTAVQSMRNVWRGCMGISVTACSHEYVSLCDVVSIYISFLVSYA